MKLLIRSQHFVLEPLCEVINDLDVGYDQALTDFWRETAIIQAETEEEVERALQFESDVLVQALPPAD